MIRHKFRKNMTRHKLHKLLPRAAQGKMQNFVFQNFNEDMAEPETPTPNEDMSSLKKKIYPLTYIMPAN